MITIIRKKQKGEKNKRGTAVVEQCAKIRDSVFCQITIIIIASVT